MVHNLEVKNSTVVLNYALKHSITIQEALTRIGFHENYITGIISSLPSILAKNEITRQQHDEFMALYDQALTPVPDRVEVRYAVDAILTWDVIQDEKEFLVQNFEHNVESELSECYTREEYDKVCTAWLDIVEKIYLSDIHNEELKAIIRAYAQMLCLETFYQPDDVPMFPLVTEEIAKISLDYARI